MSTSNKSISNGYSQQNDNTFEEPFLSSENISNDSGSLTKNALTETTDCNLEEFLNRFNSNNVRINSRSTYKIDESGRRIALQNKRHAVHIITETLVDEQNSSNQNHNSINSSIDTGSELYQEANDYLENYFEEQAKDNLEGFSVTQTTENQIQQSKIDVPDQILVSIKSLQFDFNIMKSNVKKSIHLSTQFAYHQTKPDISFEKQMENTFLFPFNYHSLIFDTLKLDFYIYESLLNTKKMLGRAIVELKVLRQAILNRSKFEGTFPIENNELLHPYEVGTVQISIRSHFHDEPPLTSVIYRASYMRDKSLPIIIHGIDELDGIEETNEEDNEEANEEDNKQDHLNFIMRPETKSTNAVRMHSDRKTIQDYFGISKDDIICWEFGHLSVSVPSYMIIRDPKTNSLIISIRGTLSATDAITDVLAYYEPWKNGFVHRGMFRSAQYLVRKSLKDIRVAVKKFKVNSIQVIGHSLGAAVSCLVTLLLRKRCKDLIEDGIDIHAWSFATPPCCSLDIACRNETKSYIDNFVNENDVVPRLSYGSFMNFKELIKFVVNELKDDNYKKISSKDKLSALMASIDDYHKNLISNSREQKLYIPGTIYYLYKKRDPYNPLLREILCEKSTQESFTDIALRKNFLLHHLPGKYDKKLRKFMKRLAKQSDYDQIDVKS
ncbi:putative class 3 lipase [Gigaspora margarita]|uniref:sn-1-specific diacylglycerol lipase n=1 Tax=Gigaspora margarita TaxID=4874 RepID=A0A8H4EHN7_GIGMA|nr:putative class 3 lipase [Gigaspora margarita]